MLDNTQREIAYLRHHLYQHTKPDDDMLLFKAVLQCKLDNTDQGLANLDKLFKKIRERGATLNNFLKKSGHKSFILTIAIYIVDRIAAKINDRPVWITYESNAKLAQQGANCSKAKPLKAKSFDNSVVAEFSYATVYPLQAIHKALLSEYSLADYVVDTASEILQHSQVDNTAERNLVCRNYLKKVSTGRLIDKDIAFYKPLSKIKFDKSLQSLVQIDDLLNALKADIQRDSVSYDDLLADSKKQAFVLLLGYYIGMTACTLARTTARWFGYEEIKILLNNPKLGYCIENNQAMIFDGGILRFPMLAVTNLLYDMSDVSVKGGVAFAQSLIEAHPSNLSSYPLSITDKRVIPDEWKAATHLAGQLAASNVSYVSANQNIPPMSIRSMSTHSMSIQPNLKDSDIVSHQGMDEVGLNSLLQALEVADSDVLYKLLSYDIYLNLPSGRTDGIAIEIRVFSDPKLKFQFMLPYRPANHRLGFAIYPIINRQIGDRPDGWLEALAQSFYEGAKGIIDPDSQTDYWTMYYIDKHDLYAPSLPIQNALPVDFDPKTSQIMLSI